MPRILIVDDDGVDRELATRCLRPIEDLEIGYAEDGDEGLESIARFAPDLVVTDLRMPGMDGLELVERVRAKDPLLPIILMTSQGNELIAVQALRAGAAHYVPKSALKETLLDAVLEVLEIAGASRSQSRVLEYFGSSETRFELTNDPTLIAPLVGYLRDNLTRRRFGDEATRTQVGMALMEAVANAMMHGNLEVDTTLRRTDRKGYDDLVALRRKQPPYAQRRVLCRARESAESVEYVVRDEGPGFDPSNLPDPTAPENMLAVSGRGVMLIRTFMDEVTYNDKGNQITMIKANPREPGG